ncbi:MAG TPA: lipase [Chloroflexia bacterium]|nr:lipase [Chloroflexia bacterium]
MQKLNEEPVVIAGGFLSSAGDYRSWQRLLAAPPYSRRSFVAQISRFDWTTTRDESFRTQLLALERAVELARSETGAEKVWLVCHSAGGRIARLWMGEKPYMGFNCGGYRYVHGVIFLGSPYTTAEPWAKYSSSFANENYPGAYYPDITYVSVIGKAVLGKRFGTVEQRFAYNAYKVLDPANPELWGDGVITLASAHVPGAFNHVIEGIHHVSYLGRPGYIAPAALSIWGEYLVPASER